MCVWQNPLHYPGHNPYQKPVLNNACQRLSYVPLQTDHLKAAPERRALRHPLLGFWTTFQPFGGAAWLLGEGFGWLLSGLHPLSPSPHSSPAAKQWVRVSVREYECHHLRLQSMECGWVCEYGCHWCVLKQKWRFKPCELGLLSFFVPSVSVSVSVCSYTASSRR